MTHKDKHDDGKSKDFACGVTDKHHECPFIKGKPLSLKSIVNIIYICQALSYLFGITAVAGLILGYLRRGEAEGAWLESHFTWQIRTFWFGLLFAIIGYALIFILIGFLILAINLVWIIYRVFKGWLLLSENRPVKNSTAWF